MAISVKNVPPFLPIAIGTSPTGEGAKTFPPWGKMKGGKNLIKYHKFLRTNSLFLLKQLDRIILHQYPYRINSYQSTNRDIQTANNCHNENHYPCPWLIG
jgi:hypothetical protein